jgi:hypothetical protein
MDVGKILRVLKAHRDRLDVCIVALQGLSSGKPRRGRPPKWASERIVSSDDLTRLAPPSGYAAPPQVSDQ